MPKLVYKYSNKILKQGKVYEVSTWLHLEASLEANPKIFFQYYSGDNLTLSSDERIIFQNLYREKFAPFILFLIEYQISSMLLNYLENIIVLCTNIFKSDKLNKDELETLANVSYFNILELERKYESIKTAIQTNTPLTQEFKNSILEILDYFYNNKSSLEKKIKEKFQISNIFNKYTEKISVVRTEVALKDIKNELSAQILALLRRNKFFECSYDLINCEIDGVFLLINQNEEENKLSDDLIYLNKKESCSCNLKTPSILVMESTVSPVLKKGKTKLKQLAKNSMFVYLFLQHKELFKKLKFKENEVEKFMELTKDKKFILPIYVSDISEFKSVEEFENIYSYLLSKNKYMADILKHIAIKITKEVKRKQPGNEESEPIKIDFYQQFAQYPVSLYSLQEKTQKSIEKLEKRNTEEFRQMSSSNKIQFDNINNKLDDHDKKFDEIKTDLMDTKKTVKEQVTRINEQNKKLDDIFDLLNEIKKQNN